MSDAAARERNDTETVRKAAGLRVPVSAHADPNADSTDDTHADSASASHADSPTTPRADVRADAHDSRGDSRPNGRLRPDARRRLTKLIIAKAFLELLLLAALAVGFHYVAFPPSFQGSLDLADARSVRGWAVDRSRPGEAVEVQLYIDNQFVAGGFANEPRPDVSAKGYAPDERHGFVFNLHPPRQGGYEARVYAVQASGGGARRTLQLIGGPLRSASK